MSTLTQFSPFSGSGASSGTTPKILPFISSTTINALGNISVTAYNYGRSSQLNANQFITSAVFNNQTNNLIYIRAVPFQISNTGVVTVGSASQSTNLSGYQLSTTTVGDVYPGETTYASYMYYNGSYRAVALNSTVTAGNVANTYVSDLGVIGSTAGYPSSYIPFATSAQTAGTRFVAYAGYNSSSYASYNFMSTAGAGYSFNSQTAPSTYSSTAYGTPAIQLYSNTASRSGLIFTHDSATLGFGVRELYGGNSASSLLGYDQSLFKQLHAGGSTVGFRLPSGNSLYFNSSNGASITTNSAGTVLGSNTFLPINIWGQIGSYGDSYRTIRAISSNVFYAPSVDRSCINIFKINEDVSTYNHTVSYLDSFYINRGNMSFPDSTPPQYDDCYFFAGSSNQYLAVVQAGYLNLFDASGLTLS